MIDAKEQRSDPPPPTPPPPPSPAPREPSRRQETHKSSSNSSESGLKRGRQQQRALQDETAPARLQYAHGIDDKRGAKKRNKGKTTSIKKGSCTRASHFESQRAARIFSSLVQHGSNLQVSANNEGDGAEVSLQQTRTCMGTCTCIHTKACMHTHTQSIMVISQVMVGRAAPRA